MIKITSFTVFVVIACISLSICNSSNKPEQPPVDILSYDAKFLIGNTIVRLPLIAAKPSEPCKQAPLYYCRIPNKYIIEVIEKTKAPFTVSAIDISIANYYSHLDSKADIYIPMPGICEKYSQLWAKKVCEPTGSRSILGGWLRNFTLVNYEHIDALNYATISWDHKTITNYLKDMNVSDNPQRICGNDKNNLPLSSCVAAVKINNHLLAVWIVGRKGKESEVKRDSQAIKAFIKYGIGETENYPALKKTIDTL